MRKNAQANENGKRSNNKIAVRQKHQKMLLDFRVISILLFVYFLMIYNRKKNKANGVVKK